MYAGITAIIERSPHPAASGIASLLGSADLTPTSPTTETCLQSARPAGRQGIVGRQEAELDDRPQFHVALTRRTDNIAVVTLAGEVDLYTAPKFQEALLQGIAEGARRVIVDLSAVTFLDSTALGVLIRGAKELGPDGGALHLVSGPGSVRRILEITGLAGVFAIHSTLDEALAAAASLDLSRTLSGSPLRAVSGPVPP